MSESQCWGWSNPRAHNWHSTTRVASDKQFEVNTLGHPRQARQQEKCLLNSKKPSVESIRICHMSFQSITDHDYLKRQLERKRRVLTVGDFYTSQTVPRQKSQLSKCCPVRAWKKPIKSPSLLKTISQKQVTRPTTSLLSFNFISKPSP